MSKRRGSTPDVSRRFYTEQREWTIGVTTDQRLTDKDRLVGVLWMQRHVNRHTACAYVSQKTLAAALGISPKTVQRSLAKLRDLNFIKFVGYHNRAKEYLAVSVTPIGDAGQQCPVSSCDTGQSKPRDRTFEGDDCGLQCPPNHKEPNEPRGTLQTLQQLKGLVTKRPPVATQSITEKWEKKLRSGSDVTAMAMMTIRRDELDVISLALEEGLIGFEDAEQRLQELSLER